MTPLKTMTVVALFFYWMIFGGIIWAVLQIWGREPLYPVLSYLHLQGLSGYSDLALTAVFLAMATASICVVFILLFCVLFIVMLPIAGFCAVCIRKKQA